MDFFMYDEKGDPVQHGVHGFRYNSSGLKQMPGKCLGIVLSVSPADSKNNLMYRFLLGEEAGTQQGSYVEADVLLLYGGQQMYVPINHVIVLPWGKCSNVGPGEGEPADWSEDVPNGCEADELEEYRKGGTRLNVDELSGDWVVVDFIGGLLQCPVITHWFQNPRNKRDASTAAKGRQFVLRRNNSEFAIDRNGDLHFTHRVGQYLQMKGERITIKHRKKSMIHMDGDGGVNVIAGGGKTSIAMDDESITLFNGNATIEIRGDNVTLTTSGGSMKVLAEKVNLTAKKVTASAGNDVDRLCREQLGFDFKDLVGIVAGFIFVFDTTVAAPLTALFTTLDPKFGTAFSAAWGLFKTGYGTTLNDLASDYGYSVANPSGLFGNVVKRVLTRVLKGE